MTKFTKGEWETFIGCAGVVEIVSDSIVIVSWQGFDDLDIPKLEKKANANLIAAAPDMYRLLVEFKEFAERQGWDHVLINSAEKSLAKARGE